jgi:LmbE family N-acetylglucosaminyl deacetylase
VTAAPVPASAPGRILAIGAHPDDIEFGCGATLAKWARAGAHVELLVLTDGSKGTWRADQDLAELVAVRRDEQRAAARTLGAHDVHFLDAVDGELEADPQRREEVCAVIRATRPDVVLGHDPWKRYRLHPDHRRAGELVIDGTVAARDPHFFPAAGTPHRPRQLLLFEAEVIDHVEPVSREDIQAKIDALMCHESQWLSTMHIEVGSEEEQEQSAVFGASVRHPIEEAGGEQFKLITEL